MRCLVAAVAPALVAGATLDSAAVQSVQQEMNQWSQANGGRGIQFVVGNALTGEETVLSAGNAAPGKPVSEATVFRMGGMTKIMAGMMAAIAFEEDVAKPYDPIIKYVPELGGMKTVRVSAGATEQTPIDRECTVWDLLGMKCGFSQGYWGMGTMAATAGVPPADGVLPQLAGDDACGGLLYDKSGKVVRVADWLACRVKHPLLTQPGGRALYGQDYEVLGLVLAKAYEKKNGAWKDPAALMKEKLWDPLGMTSAFMGWSPTATADVADLVLDATTPGTGSWASSASWGAAQSDVNLKHLVGAFAPEQGGASFPGMSGYGFGAFMTFSDYAKFVAALARRGVGENGQRVLGVEQIAELMRPARAGGPGLGFASAMQFQNPGMSFSEQTEWRWGFGARRMRHDTGNDWSGAPLWRLIAEDSAGFAQWDGIFGSMFRMDSDSGFYAVGGENTLPPHSGAAQAGAEFVKSNIDRWLAMVSCAKVILPPPETPAPTPAPTPGPTPAPTPGPTPAPTPLPAGATSTPSTSPTAGPVAAGSPTKAPAAGAAATDPPTGAPKAGGVVADSSSPTLNCEILSVSACQQTSGCKVVGGGCAAAELGGVLEETQEAISDGWMPALLTAVGVLTVCTMIALFSARKKRLTAADFHTFDKAGADELAEMKPIELAEHNKDFSHQRGGDYSPVLGGAEASQSGAAAAGQVTVTVQMPSKSGGSQGGAGSSSDPALFSV
eukprot:TRINITY_DN282_c0_g1_i5.p1 TRINITY_DN282_c0_g1~~TRINITY_DN282_c0_g1_i5.p1  ORF type:complete len:725 (+),score=227.83 TRINITY_DN282_c0_g1_i5:750-2924(+)